MPSEAANKSREQRKSEAAADTKSAAVMQLLKPLDPFLEDESLTEICINRPGEVWTESRKGWAHHVVPQLSMELLMSLAKVVATYTGQAINEQKAILSGTLPLGERLQLVVPPTAAPGTVSFTIRKPSQLAFTLDDYETQGALKLCNWTKKAASKYDDYKTSPILEDHERELVGLLVAGKTREFLERAVTSHQNVLVSGGTGSGKTTFTKAILLKIPTHERLISVENVDELNLYKTHKNSVSLFYSAGGQGISKSGPKELMESALRMKPDRVLLAELIRGEEAFYYLRNVGSGHPGSITTMHANSSREAVEQLATIMKESETGATLTREEIKTIVVRNIDVVVQINVVVENGLKERLVTEIYYDPKFKKSFMD